MRSRVRPTAIGLSFFAFILIGGNDSGVGVLLPSIGAQYGVDKATLGLLFLAATGGYLVAAFSSGLLSHRFGNRLFLSLGAVSFILGVAPFALTLPFVLLLVGLLALGFGVGIMDAGLNAYIAGLRENAAKLNYLHAFYGVGALIGPLVASAVLAFGWAWNIVYYVWGVFAVLILVGFLWLFPGLALERGDAGNSVIEERGNVLLEALKLRTVWLAALFLLFYVGTEVSLGNWGYTFLTEERHEAALFSGWSISGYWMGLTVGRFLLGRVAVRIGNDRLIQGCLVGTVAGVLIVWLLPFGWAALVGLWVTGFSLGPIYPTTVALMSQLVPSRLLTSTIGLLASFGSVGAALFSWLAGTLAQWLGLDVLLPYVLALTVATLALWIALNAERISATPTM